MSHFTDHIEKAAGVRNPPHPTKGPIDVKGKRRHQHQIDQENHGIPSGGGTGGGGGPAWRPTGGEETPSP